MPLDATTETLDLMTIQAVADWLAVAKSTVETWIYNRDLPSFRKGGLRKINRADVVRFVMLNTIRPRRPDWLTAQAESEFKKLLAEIVAVEVRKQFQAEAQRRELLQAA